MAGRAAASRATICDWNAQSTCFNLDRQPVRNAFRSFYSNFLLTPFEGKK
jgi:hypothetical protein